MGSQPIWRRRARQSSQENRQDTEPWFARLWPLERSDATSLKPMHKSEPRTR